MNVGYDYHLFLMSVLVCDSPVTLDIRTFAKSTVA